MRKVLMFSLLLVTLAAMPSYAQESQHPEAIAEKMAFKLVRGVANVTTAVVEIPKQTYMTIRDRGDVGYAVGPLKGVGMAFYRLLVGVTETVFFAVPEPGYYDPMIEPEYVWQGWGEPRVEPRNPPETAQAEKKGE